jgi:hypothetical protein
MSTHHATSHVDARQLKLQHVLERHGVLTGLPARENGT